MLFRRLLFIGLLYVVHGEVYLLIVSCAASGYRKVSNDRDAIKHEYKIVLLTILFPACSHRTDYYAGVTYYFRIPYYCH